MLAIKRWTTGLLVLLLQACGGGGGGGGGGGSGPDPAPRLSVDTTEISVSAQPGDEFPRSQVTLTITNPPEEGLFVGAQYTANGISTLDFAAISATQGQLLVYFQLPSSIENGTYDDTIELQVCTDEQCANDIAGSPVTITTSYVVSGSRTASIDRNSIEYRTDTQQEDYRTESVRLTIPSPPFGGAYIRTDYSSNAIVGVTTQGVSQTVTNVQIEILSGRSMRPGVYDDTVTITVCYDNSCARQLEGSPFVVTSHVTVDAGPEPGIDPLEVLSRAALPHDLIDAEYSETLDAVVMVGAYPANALYVYDVNTGTERQLLLATTPTAVSVAPDGLTAAVGHDALITVVDLTQVGQPGAPAPTLLNVSADVLDIVLDGRGRVHALERFAEWQDIHTVDIAANTEQLSSGRQVYGGSLGRLHPSGNYIYTADNGISPSDIEKWDITSGSVAWVSDSPYHGDHAMCGNLWFRRDGATIYTACGNTFGSSTDPAQDMLYTGGLELFAPRDYDWLIRSLSHSSVTSEIALVEAETDSCDRTPAEAGRCLTHLASYESDFLGRQSVHSIGPFTVGERAYQQRGLFVFHDAAGSRKILLSKLDGMANPDTEYYLSVIN
jgi:hypothetical protein